MRLLPSAKGWFITREYGIGVWVSQKRENFLAYLKSPESTDVGPFFGWLCTPISYDPEETLYLKTMAYFRSGTLRLAILLEPTDHPLAVVSATISRWRRRG